MAGVKKEKSLLLAKIKSEPIFFPVLWQFFLKGVPVFSSFAKASADREKRRLRAEGGLGGRTPANVFIPYISL